MISGVGGLKVQERSGRVPHQWLPSPLPPTLLTKKILTGFLRFAWTPLGSSGEGESGQLRRCQWC